MLAIGRSVFMFLVHMTWPVPALASSAAAAVTLAGLAGSRRAPALWVAACAGSTPATRLAQAAPATAANASRRGAERTKSS